MTKAKSIIASVLVVAMSAAAFASAPTRRSASASILPGYWHINYKKAFDYAKANNLPHIAVWSKGESQCSHCGRFEKGVNSSVFKNWMKTSGMVFSFDLYKDSGGYGDVGGAAWNFCYESQELYPLVRVVWYKNGKKMVDKYYMGDDLIGTKTGKEAGKKQVAFLKNLLKNFTPPAAEPKYTGGQFETPGTDHDRLEAEPGVTTSVDVSLVRTNATVAVTVSTNSLVVAYPNGSVVTNVVNWAAGDVAKNVKVAIDESLSGTDAPIALTLLDAAGKSVATSKIAIVAPENSPSNPYYIGEKTADTLDWGEWTMDIDVATNKVAKFNSERAADKKAYTLLLLQGALWCPDCHNTDVNLLEKKEFVEWAKSHNVALVAIDLPRASGTTKYTTCSLLTRDAGSCSWAEGGKSSGAGYLSRKMVDETKTADVVERNWEIAQNLRLPNWSNPLRPPVPSLFLLRDDGTVAARMQYFGGVKSPSDDSNLEAHLLRLDEMLAMYDDSAEETNDKRQTTTESVGKRAKVLDRTISMIDSADVYRLDPEETPGKRISFTLTNPNNAEIALTVVEVASDKEQTLASTTVTNGERSVSASVKSTNCYAVVSYVTESGEAKDPYFSVASKSSTLAAYSLETDFIVDPSDVAQTNTITDGVMEMTVALVSNQLYRITGLADNSQYLTATNGTVDCLYVAQATGDFQLALSDATVVCQKWNPGVVGFAQTSAAVAESAGTYKLRISRADGVSGAGSATVSLNAGLSSEYIDLLGLPDSMTVSWEEGDGETKEIELAIVENDFADGDQTFIFDCGTDGDVTSGRLQFRLTIRENDKSAPGRIAISETEPSMGNSMAVYARAGSSVDVGLVRKDGTSGEQKVTFSATSGTIDETSLTWDNRSADPKNIQWTMPSSTGKSVLTMKPAKGSYVDSAARVLTAYVLAADVRGFVRDVVTVDATRYVPVTGTRVALDSCATDSATVKKFSGTLAAGLVWKYDSDAKELVITGVPTKAGTYTAVFRAYNGSTAGLTVSVTVNVSDPVKQGGGTGGNEPLNASVANSRTFADIPVLDATTKRLAGLLTVTVPRSGRVSAKYRSVAAAKTVTLSSASWSGIDGEGTLDACLADKSGEYGMTVAARADGTVEIEFADPEYPGDTFKLMLTTNKWSKSNPATDFKGYYTVSLPRKETLSGTVLAAGDGYVTLKMNTSTAIHSGKFAYAGLLPDGRGFSGSTSIIPQDWTTFATSNYWSRGVLPMLTIGTLDTVSGAVQINPGAYDSTTGMNVDEQGFGTGRCWYKYLRRSVRPATETDIFWRHTEKSEGASCEALLDAFGTYYLSTENSFRSCCVGSLGTDKLTFYVLNEDGRENSSWTVGSTTYVNVTYPNTGTKKKPKYVNKIAAASTKGALTSFSFTLSTGIVTGKLKYGGSTYTYKGVVMPGWGSQECGECGFGGSEAGLRPFISGAVWKDTSFKYTDALNRERTVTVRTGLPFSVGVKPGE